MSVRGYFNKTSIALYEIDINVPVKHIDSGDRFKIVGVTKFYIILDELILKNGKYIIGNHYTICKTKDIWNRYKYI